MKRVRCNSVYVLRVGPLSTCCVKLMSILLNVLPVFQKKIMSMNICSPTQGVSIMT